jgi:hypothetical protein
MLAMLVSACAVPAEYMGIATRAPVPPAQRLRIEEALAKGTPAEQGCPWPAAAGGLALVPCELLPASQLAGLAWAANKPAALELGIRFEEGRGVHRDPDKARQLYRIAAASSGGTIYVWVPGAGDNPGHLMPVFAPEEPGLAAARTRLEGLEKLLPPDAAKARGGSRP